MAETIQGIDVYHGDAPLNFHELFSAGNRFAFLKSSQGSTGVDPAYPDYATRSKSVGFVQGAYHYFTSDSPTQQAEHFLNTANLSAGDLVHVLDVETLFADVAARAKEAAQVIKNDTGRWPIIYSGDSFYQDNLKDEFPEGDYTLWIARYPDLPVTACAFHQFTDRAQFAMNPPLDCSQFFGSLSDLQGHCL